MPIWNAKHRQNHVTVHAYVYSNAITVDFVRQRTSACISIQNMLRFLRTHVFLGRTYGNVPEQSMKRMISVIKKKFLACEV